MVGNTLGRYRVVDQIGAGGMGVVYKALDERLQRYVALKVLGAALRDEHARSRFRREARLLSQLSHPNIATAFDFDNADGIDFLVMEYVEGERIDSTLRQSPLSIPRLLDLARQLASGLRAAHEHGIVHRDLKPANLRIASDGRLKILDFGIAKLTASNASAADTTVTATADGSVVGTLPYMAPEQLRGETVDERADIYAAGAVLFELATARRPFDAPTA
jgi:eukaryotic-like serine/threonine-protein kinase